MEIFIVQRKIILHTSELELLTAIHESSHYSDYAIVILQVFCCKASKGCIVNCVFMKERKCVIPLYFLFATRPLNSSWDGSQDTEENLSLHIGSPVNISFSYINKYDHPLDLYYLMDFTVTMLDDQVRYFTLYQVKKLPFHALVFLYRKLWLAWEIVCLTVSRINSVHFGKDSEDLLISR